MFSWSPDWKYLFLTAALASLLGVQVYRDLAPETAPVRMPRGPASIAPPVPISPINQDYLYNWKVDCRGKETFVRVSGDRLRIRGSLCGRTPSELSLVNESNGFTATIFPSARGFETDLITLESGENRIFLRYGNVRRKLSVLVR